MYNIFGIPGGPVDIYIYHIILNIYIYYILCDKCPTGPPVSPGASPEPLGACSKNDKNLIFGRLRFRFFGGAMNRELNQRMGLEKLVCKPPTSVFDIPSSRRYGTKHEKMMPRASPEEKNMRASPIRRFLI